MRGFYCIGAYTEAILATKVGLSFWIALPLGGVMAAVIGLLVATPTLKLRGTYLAIVTLGASEIIRLVALNWEGLTGGPIGIKGIPLAGASRLQDFEIDPLLLHLPCAGRPFSSS